MSLGLREDDDRTRIRWVRDLVRVLPEKDLLRMSLKALRDPDTDERARRHWREALARRGSNSLLPALRGAAPINWAIARGYRETGVTIMRMVAAMDAGAIIHHLPQSLGRSPEAEAAAALFETLAPRLSGALAECSSAREKRDRDQWRDFELASELDVSQCVPGLSNDAYTNVA